MKFKKFTSKRYKDDAFFNETPDGILRNFASFIDTAEPGVYEIRKVGDVYPNEPVRAEVKSEKRPGVNSLNILVKRGRVRCDVLSFYKWPSMDKADVYSCISHVLDDECGGEGCKYLDGAACSSYEHNNYRFACSQRNERPIDIIEEFLDEFGGMLSYDDKECAVNFLKRPVEPEHAHDKESA